jgi:beta-phosphoglucomutase-like phosphatase (HAD superfamily)
MAKHLDGIIFDVDGTLAETEDLGHRLACNEAFHTMGYAFSWSSEEFKALQPIAGNRKRMRMALETLEPSMGEVAIDEAVRALFALKQRLYIEKYLPTIPLREGVRELVAEAVARGVKLSVVTTSDEPQVHALLDQKLPEFKGHFHPILGKLAGEKTAPHAPLHHRCLAEMGTARQHTLVIEDYEVGMQAAVRAEIPVAVFYNSYTFGQGFAGAALVAPSLAHFNLDLLTAICMPDC